MQPVLITEQAVSNTQTDANATIKPTTALGQPLIMTNNISPIIDYRLAKTDELKELKTFLFEHGTNPWNHLPPDGVDNEFRLIAAQQAHAFAAYVEGQLVGFTIFYLPQVLPDNYLQYTDSKPAIYIAEAVVHREFSGRGIGSCLLKNIIALAPTLGARMLLLDRHAENAASAGMMRKAGFEELATFEDLSKRDYGNRCTTVLGYNFN